MLLLLFGPSAAAALSFQNPSAEAAALQRQLLPKHSAVESVGFTFRLQHGMLFCLLPLHQPAGARRNSCHGDNSALISSPCHSWSSWWFQHQRWGCFPHQDGPNQLKKSHCFQQLQVIILRLIYFPTHQWHGFSADTKATSELETTPYSKGGGAVGMFAGLTILKIFPDCQQGSMLMIILF